MTYGEKIRLLRTARHLTQKRLGELCDYVGESADRTVRGWETNEQYPPITKLRQLAAALQVPLEELIP